MSRSIHLAKMPEGKTRPVLLLTRGIAQPHLISLTVAPIYSTIRGIRTEVPVGPRNGLDHASVVALDNVTTLHHTDLGRQVGILFQDQEEALAGAVVAAFDLEI